MRDRVIDRARMHRTSSREHAAAEAGAFEQLVRELGELSAPAELGNEALRSAIEEIEHARIVTALAARYSASPEPVVLAARARRTPLAIALENAVEGCVRESYGALVAVHQAATARDLEVRFAMATIARDELRHARLAWRVAAWLEPRLSEVERRQLASARAFALVELARELEPALSPEACAAIGWPAQEVGARMLAQLAFALQREPRSA